MNNFYCDIFTDCYHCPAPVCPYNRREQEREDNEETEGDEETGVKKWERSLILPDEDSED